MSTPTALALLLRRLQKDYPDVEWAKLISFGYSWLRAHKVPWYDQEDCLAEALTRAVAAVPKAIGPAQNFLCTTLRNKLVDTARRLAVRRFGPQLSQLTPEEVLAVSLNSPTVEDQVSYSILQDLVLCAIDYAPLTKLERDASGMSPKDQRERNLQTRARIKVRRQLAKLGVTKEGVA